MEQHTSSSPYLESHVEAGYVFSSVKAKKGQLTAKIGAMLVLFTFRCSNVDILGFGRYTLNPLNFVN